MRSITCPLCGKNICDLKHKFSLNEMDALLARFLRFRMVSGLLQLAYLLSSTCALTSKGGSQFHGIQVKKLLLPQTSAYWEVHFIFSKPSPRRQNFGVKIHSILFLLIQWFRSCMLYGITKAMTNCCQRAGSYLELLREIITVIRLWQAAGIEVESAADSQAIQLQKEYCDKRIVFVTVLVTSTSNINKSALLILFFRTYTIFAC